MPAFRDITFPTTREAALAQARQFAPHMGGDYSKNRNSVVPGHAAVSRLAPALRVRLIGEHEITQIALDEFKDLGHCEKFVQEVYWRAYWRSWLELRPDVWNRYQQNVRGTLHNLTKAQHKRIQQIENGESGVAPIDEFARELVETGYMHNHARMWFAAYWIHTEGLPFELGADFFERHLVCACPASNTLSWRWVVGLQTRGKAYLARRSNLEKFCDPAYLGDEVGMESLENPKEAPLPEDTVVEPQTPQFDLNFQTPQGKVGLWITEDDLSPETSQLANASVDAICVSVLAAPHAAPTSNGKRRTYRVAASHDAGKRATQHWNREAQNVEAKHADELSRQLVDWAKQHDLNTVVALKPFVGPTGDALTAVQAHLKDEGVALVLLRRPEDAHLLSFATAGYFRFWQACKKQVPMFKA